MQTAPRSAALLLLAPLVLSPSAVAQAHLSPTHTPPQQAAAKIVPPPPPPGPTVHPDRSVTFRFPAPGAREVQLLLEGADPQPMARDATGVWSLTTGPLEPQYYGYGFRADGIPYPDPGNVETKPNLLSLQNEIEVPGPQPMDWDMQNVPHGALHHHFYLSKTLGRQSDFFVYTPPGYDPAQKYPVLYLLHGYSDNASGWTAVGRANAILDNLLAQGRIRPMVVVMPLGYGTMEMIEHSWGVWRDKALIDRNFELFTQVLMQEIVPQANSLYSLSAERDDHAIAGLSMGGGESLRTGLTHLDSFAYIGGFSSAIDGDYDRMFPQLAAAASSKQDPVRVLWVSCGSDDPLLSSSRAFLDWLHQQQIPVTFTETPGGRHTWMVWRRNLIDFAPLLFRR